MKKHASHFSGLYLKKEHGHPVAVTPAILAWDAIKKIYVKATERTIKNKYHDTNLITKRMPFGFL
jgi:2-methylcitrate dehydratase PrpD